jgi:KDO2-lipid IV(A) lauroyltransferase
VAKYFLFSHKIAKRWPQLSRVGWRIEALAIGALVGIFRMLPLERATRLAHVLFSLMGSRSSKHNRVMGNLHVAFPDKSRRECNRLARDIFGHAGVAFAEIVHLANIWKERDRRLEFVVSEEIRFLRERGRPAVLVTAHVGAWTLTGFNAEHFGFPVSIVYWAESNPYVRDIMLRLRSALPVRLLPQEGSLRSLIHELSQGASVGLGSDGRLDAGEMIPFFGHDMATNTVPARLALRFDCELIPTRAQRLPGGRYRITMYAPVRPDDPAASVAEQAANMTAKLNVQFEQWIRETPGEWLCMRRRWPKDVERAAEQRARQRAS